MNLKQNMAITSLQASSRSYKPRVSLANIKSLVQRLLSGLRYGAQLRSEFYLSCVLLIFPGCHLVHTIIIVRLTKKSAYFLRVTMKFSGCVSLFMCVWVCLRVCMGVFACAREGMRKI